MADACWQAWQWLIGFDETVWLIVVRSLHVSLCALLIGTVFGLPLGAWLAVSRFRGRSLLVVALNTLMGLPSVLVGVLVYLVLSRSGPLGHYGLLFSPTAMILAQSCLVTPMMAALTRQIIADRWQTVHELFVLYQVTGWRRMALLVHDCRHSLLVAMAAGLGRAMSEVGAVMIVGGNIDGYTRVMTTTIALETSKGDLPLSLALGTVLLGLIFMINALIWQLRRWERSR